MKIYAHRGFSGEYPENTMLAFEKAVEVRSDGIELDVHLSKDGKLIVIHDEFLLRTTGKPGKVSDYDRSELIKINAGKTKDDKFGFTPIVEFEDYCNYIKDKDIITNIEIKTNNIYYPGIEEKAIELVKKYKLEEKVIFSSFNWLSVIKIKELVPYMKSALLQEDYLTQNIGNLEKSFKINYYHPDGRLLDDNIVENCKINDIKINSWAVNELEIFIKMKKWNIEGIITNYPDLMINMK
ncbi:MAG: glycerophosphodiester phosphodiesterase [Spirochaetia bacterium]|nr:glycerophosphodiester phosphodiesterase [Spirochaetia bacterium]